MKPNQIVTVICLQILVVARPGRLQPLLTANSKGFQNVLSVPAVQGCLHNFRILSSFNENSESNSVYSSKVISDSGHKK